MDEPVQREHEPAVWPGGGRGMRDLVERALFLAIGVAAVGRDRLQPVVDEFVERGRLSAEDGRALIDRVAERSRTEIHSLLGTGTASYAGGERAAVDLEFRLRAIEHRLDLLERQFDGWREPAE